MAYDWTTHKLAETFTTPYQQYKERRGQMFTLIGEVPREAFDYAEVGAIFRIRFADGEEIEAWPEEIFIAA